MNKKDFYEKLNVEDMRMEATIETIEKIDQELELATFYVDKGCSPEENQSEHFASICKKPDCLCEVVA